MASCKAAFLGPVAVLVTTRLIGCFEFRTPPGKFLGSFFVSREKSRWLRVRNPPKIALFLPNRREIKVVALTGGAKLLLSPNSGPIPMPVRKHFAAPSRQIFLNPPAVPVSPKAPTFNPSPQPSRQAERQRAALPFAMTDFKLSIFNFQPSLRSAVNSARAALAALARNQLCRSSQFLFCILTSYFCLSYRHWLFGTASTYVFCPATTGDGGATRNHVPQLPRPDTHVGCPMGCCWLSTVNVLKQ